MAIDRYKQWQDWMIKWSEVKTDGTGKSYKPAYLYNPYTSAVISGIDKVFTNIPIDGIGIKFNRYQPLHLDVIRSEKKVIVTNEDGVQYTNVLPNVSNGSLNIAFFTTSSMNITIKNGSGSPLQSIPVTGGVWRIFIQKNAASTTTTISVYRITSLGESLEQSYALNNLDAYSVQFNGAIYEVADTEVEAVYLTQSEYDGYLDSMLAGHQSYIDDVVNEAYNLLPSPTFPNPTALPPGWIKFDDYMAAAPSGTQYRSLNWKAIHSSEASFLNSIGLAYPNGVSNTSQMLSTLFNGPASDKAYANKEWLLVVVTACRFNENTADIAAFYPLMHEGFNYIPATGATYGQEGVCDFYFQQANVAYINPAMQGMTQPFFKTEIDRVWYVQMVHGNNFSTGGGINYDYNSRYYCLVVKGTNGFYIMTDWRQYTGSINEETGAGSQLVYQFDYGLGININPATENYVDSYNLYIKP
ncbi:MAG: hypothetical protein KatS3mg087_1885 [Patescibacteria group bacterium]|nr:MAG: hypothetical protein KatS3mg087_1885 [Patescibacteria group bacterium]